MKTAHGVVCMASNDGATTAVVIPANLIFINYGESHYGNRWIGYATD